MTTSQHVGLASFILETHAALQNAPAPRRRGDILADLDQLLDLLTVLSKGLPVDASELASAGVLDGLIDDVYELITARRRELATATE
jgi:hypothetical protein